MGRKPEKKDDGAEEGVDEAREDGSDGDALEQALAQLEGERDRYLRLAAEFDNFRKRTEREMAEFKRRATDDVLLALLDVIDNLDRALDASGSCSIEEIVSGLRAIRGQMGAVVEREGVEPIDAVGVELDPYSMEAVMMMPSTEVAEGSVVRELARGYRGRGYVLRPSKVIVSSGPPGGGPGVATDGPKPQENLHVEHQKRK